MARSDVIGSGHLTPWSEQALGRFAGGLNSPMQAFLQRFAFQSSGFFLDDFTADTLSTDDWTSALSTSATAAVLSGGVANALGVLRLTTAGAADNDVASVRSYPIYRGDNNCGMEVRFRTSVGTSISVEIGFVDVLTDYTLPGVTDIDTPATGNGVADIAVFHLDTDQTLTSAAFATDGSTSGYNATATTLRLGKNRIVGDGADSGTAITLTASNFYTVRVQLAGDASKCLFFDSNGRRLAFQASAVHGTAAASSVEGGTALQAWVMLRTRAAANINMDIDYVALWQDRVARTTA